MTTREHTRAPRAAPDVVISSETAPPVPAGPSARVLPDRYSARRRAAVVLVVLFAITLTGAAAAAIYGGDGSDEAVAPPGEQVVQVPTAPDPLVVRVDGPGSATVGQPVELSVTYSDGSGIFSGTSEEWGDGIGASSIREGQCTAAAPAPDALADTYGLTHTWTEPGTYTVAVGVTSYSCREGAAVQEKATETLTVKVFAG